jgi:hypothetical protein
MNTYFSYVIFHIFSKIKDTTELFDIWFFALQVEIKIIKIKNGKRRSSTYYIEPHPNVPMKIQLRNWRETPPQQAANRRPCVIWIPISLGSAQ